MGLEPQRKRMRPFPLTKMREPPEAERHSLKRLFMKIFGKNVAILLLLAKYCVGLRPAAVIKCVFSYVVIRSIDVMYILQDFQLSGTRTV